MPAETGGRTLRRGSGIGRGPEGSEFWVCEDQRDCAGDAEGRAAGQRARGGAGPGCSDYFSKIRHKGEDRMETEGELAATLVVVEGEEWPEQEVI